MAIATPKSTNPKILITGANGLLGQKLVKQLADEGKFEVIATGKGPCRLIGDGFTYQSLDITNEAEVNEVISKIAPETIIHSAAMTNVDECELNQEACKKSKCECDRIPGPGCRKGSVPFHFRLH